MNDLHHKTEPNMTNRRRKHILNTLEHKGLHFLRNLKQEMEAYNTKAASIAMRKHILEKQKQGDYQREFENIRGVLSHSSLPFQTVKRLKERGEKLKELGAKAVTMN